jgi:bile acid:Na+ symporter, BASS family
MPGTAALKHLALLCLLAAVLLLAFGRASQTGPFVIVGCASLAGYCMGRPSLAPYAFTLSVFAFVAVSMYFPRTFSTWWGFDLALLIVPLIQIIMFGMGTTLSPADFARVLRMPWPVGAGLLLQFGIMPLAGFAIAKAFAFEPEIAAGVILVGSVAGGVASNLITYLAGGDVALSVTMTACSTLLSPLMTPFLMKTLAGRLVPIDFVAMMLSILDMTIVPVVAGLVAHEALYGRSRPRRLVAGALAGIGAALVVGVALDASALGPFRSLRGGLVLGAALLGGVCLAKLVVEGVLRGPSDWMDRALPVVSMAGICVIIAVITARSRDKLLSVGPALIAAAILHNAIGYSLGYWLSRALRLGERTARTIAIEVGMQNGGMASGLAMSVLHSSDAALAPAIFGPWQNVSGSLLASWWRRSPLLDAGRDGEEARHGAS